MIDEYEFHAPSYYYFYRIKDSMIICCCNFDIKEGFLRGFG
jgi:hypothetical protein